MPFVITITGPSRAGKSTTVDYMLKHKSIVFDPVLVPKFTTRLPRKGDEDEEEVTCVDEIPRQCDLVYEQYGKRYGLELKTILEHIEAGKSPIVILNDVRAVEDIRNSLGRLVRSIFIFRKDPTSEEYHKELQGSRRPDEAEIRFDKARTIFRIYIENIHLFDHVIINSRGFEDLDTQVRAIVNGLEQDQHWPLREKEE